jgi:hypothetical protein
MTDDILPILLLPRHITPISEHLPLLREIQALLNKGYTKTYCANPEIFGTKHIRIADPAQLADIVGESGFTVILVRLVASDETEQNTRLCEVVATGSVKDFGDGDVESYLEWSQNLSGAEWAAKNAGNVAERGPQKKKTVQKYEVCAFSVSPDIQRGGLGVRVLNEIEWLVSNPKALMKVAQDHHQVSSLEGLAVQDTTGLHNFEAVDLNHLKAMEVDSQHGELDQAPKKPELVLMAFRELGNEDYYLKRGFKTLWTSVVPVGMWDSRKECTIVYMKKDI